MVKILSSEFKKKWHGKLSSTRFKLKFFFIDLLKKLRSNKFSLFLRRFIGASKILSTWERRFSVFLLVVFVLGMIFFIREKYLAKTSETPDCGGAYVEGIVGQPGQINPIFAVSDIDRTISRLVFRGLTKPSKNQKIVGDIAQYKISADGLRYTFTIKKDVFWHDGEKVISDDVLFTISLLSDPDYNGPYVGIWDNVSAEKISDRKLIIELSEPYAPFLESTLIGILPSHILGGLSVNDIAQSEFGANPIGCGPYKIAKSMAPKEKRIKFLTLEKFDNFFEKNLKIEKITFNFYEKWRDAVLAFEKGEITGIANLTPDKERYFTTRKDLVLHKYSIPQYMGLFLNIKKELLANQKIRMAIFQAIDKKNIFKIYGGEGRIIESPILPGTTGYRALADYKYSEKDAIRIIKEQGYRKNKQGIYEKNGKKLSFTLATVNNTVDQEIARAIRVQLKNVGIKIQVKSLPLSNLQQEYIIPRQYDFLLIGINLGLDPDPYPFWHSSQAKGEGLNLANISDSGIDSLLSLARRTLNNSERAKIYQDFAEVLHKKAVAVFLYQPDYVFGTNRAVRGIKENWLISDADRFFFVEDWYIKTRRVGK